jgi:hypothetical protein
MSLFYHMERFPAPHKLRMSPFFVVTWPPNLISSDTFKGISGPDSDEKLAPNIIDKYKWTR